MSMREVADTSARRERADPDADGRRRAPLFTTEAVNLWSTTAEAFLRGLGIDES